MTQATEAKHTNEDATPEVSREPAALSARFAGYATEYMQKYVFAIPRMAELHIGKWTHPGFYRRHMIEAILRIRLNNEADSYCLFKISKTDLVLAQKLAKYLEEEFGHENMFVTDLKAMGLTEEDINRTEPLFATHLLIGFLRLSTDLDGPMATMIWNWFVEWYSVTYNAIITEKAQEVVGEKATRGTKAHINLDGNYDHVSLMFSTVERVIKTPADEVRAREYLRRFVILVAQYYDELATTTLGD